MDSRPCGVFDSGVGGLSVLRHIQHRLPSEHLIYLADQAHVPYGKRPQSEVRHYAEGITRFLLDQGCKLVVVACNTASAAALQHLRATFPETPFVGMEPAIKPAAGLTRTGVIGLLATPVTLQGELLASTARRYAEGLHIMEAPLPGLVERIEAGDMEGPATRLILEQALNPMLRQGADVLVLGCTHYPFVVPLIETIAGPSVQVLDPSPAIARQTARLLAERDLLAPFSQLGETTFFTSGDGAAFSKMVRTLLDVETQALSVHWDDQAHLHRF